MTEALKNDTVAVGRAAFKRHAWREAYEALGAADSDEPLHPVDLERLADAAWWLGRLDDVIGALERAYTGYQAAGRRRDAARVAVRLSAEGGHKQQHAG